ncbi:MAG: hypothetical protein H0T91_02890, partial [Propionibacteriaceae bacterium]|nr:hypothetical protein [Propionibacteriaceae bacterium]
ETGTRLGTGRMVRQAGPRNSGIDVDGLEHPVTLGYGPDGALYLTYPALEPGELDPQGFLLRIDLSAP